MSSRLRWRQSVSLAVILRAVHHGWRGGLCGGLATFWMVGAALGQVALNNGTYPLNTALNANNRASGTLADLGGHDGITFDFDYALSGNRPRWASGIQFQTPGGLEQIWTQHRRTGFDTQIAVFTMRFSAPVAGLALSHGGLDFNDTVRVSASLNGSVVPITESMFGSFTGGVRILSSDANTVTTNGPAGANSDETAIQYRVTLPADTAIDEIVFEAGKLTSNNNNVTLAFYDFDWDPALPSIEGQKQVALEAGADFAVPGTDVFYIISATNTGSMPADADSIFIADRLPDDVIFYNGDIGGGASVTFNDSGSGLSFDSVSDLGFSDATSAPADMSDCGYSPDAGYDDDIRYVCINPKGVFAAGDPDPAFSVEFRTQIR